MNYMHTYNDSTILLHLSLIDGVGPATVAHIVATKSEFGSLNFLYDCDEGDLRHKLGLSPKTAALLRAGLADHSALDRELSLIEKHHIDWISLVDERYPHLLANISGAPIGLYVRGDVTALSRPSLAVVGSRDATSYGTRVITSLVPPVVHQGYTIVSGGAYGVDTAAHKAALEAGGTTSVVCGSGLLRPYPRVNERLFETIVDKGGALVSSFALFTEPHPGNFPARNRIISGISQGCLVIQAAAKSGSLITAEYALNQGRHVFAVPGPIDDPRSAGCNHLIQQGAQLVCSPADIIQVLGGMQLSIDHQQALVEQPKQQQVAQVGRSSLEERILDACRQATSFDELLEHTGLSLVDLQKVLFSLQLEGVIFQNGAGLWERA